MKHIQVLGSGCINCHTLLKNTKEAVSKANISAQVEYVTDMRRIAESGVMRMPALIMDGKVLSSGRVLKTDEIVLLIR